MKKGTTEAIEKQERNSGKKKSVLFRVLSNLPKEINSGSSNCQRRYRILGLNY